MQQEQQQAQSSGTMLQGGVQKTGTAPKLSADGMGTMGGVDPNMGMGMSGGVNGMGMNGMGMGGMGMNGMGMGGMGMGGMGMNGMGMGNPGMGMGNPGMGAALGTAIDVLMNILPQKNPQPTAPAGGRVVRRGKT
ncbi:MAG TPA: hypothetical protein V6D17_23400 [Candidatus Obscuribacterales bacterium]